MQFDLKPALLLLCFALIHGACSRAPETLPFFNTADFKPNWIEKDDPRYKAIHTVSAFSFIDQNGDTITEQTIEDKIVVVDFFFTICPGICPRLTKNMGTIQQVFMHDISIKLLSHSVTPELDSVPSLRQYAAIYKVDGEKWHLLTGNRKEMYRIARDSYFADEETGVKKTENDFIHTENFILLDGKQRIRGVYNGTNPAEVERLIEDIRILKKESGDKNS
jgi:protein SCO1/2